MQLVSKFLFTLDGNFESSNVKKAFYETNQLYLSRKHTSDEEIVDFLDACKEFFPLSYLMEDKNYSRFYKRLMSLYNSECFQM